MGTEMIFGLIGGLIGWLAFGVFSGLILGLTFGLISGLFFGFGEIHQHYIIRLVLWLYDLAPLNYARFLDYCTERIFLHKVGGSYVFIHRYLLECFVSLENPENS